MGDALITEYMVSFDTAALKPLICADTQPFTCLFEGNHMDSCRAVLEAGKGFGIAIPMSVAELTSECGSGNTNTSTMHLDAPAAVHKDAQPHHDRLAHFCGHGWSAYVGSGSGLAACARNRKCEVCGISRTAPLSGRMRVVIQR